MYYQLVTGPTSEPVSLDEAKIHLHAEDIEDTNFDNYVRRLIKAARLHIEKVTNYVCISSVLAAYDDQWPSGDRIYLLKYPVTAISKVEYYASDDAVAYTELAATSFDASIMYNPPVVKLKDTPSLGDKLNAVKVTFTAGHTGTVDDPVPENVKQAILVLVATMHENRQEEVSGTITSKFEIGFEYLLDQIRLATP
jgi:uncharacterized phiE125 gp8 family phage protein